MLSIHQHQEKTSLLMKDWKKDAVFLTEDEARRYINRNINFIDYEDRIENWPSFPNPTF